jgi:hypothetical protein
MEQPLVCHLSPYKKNVVFKDWYVVATDVENNGEIGGAESATHMHNYGYHNHRKRAGRGKYRYEVELIDTHFTDLNDWQESILSFSGRKKGGKVPVTFFGHNWGYDYTFLQAICDDSAKLTNNGHFISGRTVNGIRLFDTLNFYKGTIEDAIRDFRMEERYGIVKLPLSPETLAARNRFDAMATYRLAEIMVDYYRGQGINMRYTAPACALEIWHRNFFPPGFSVYRDGVKGVAINDFELSSYKGGNNQAIIRGIVDIASFDVHSMYPSVMRDELYPDPMSARHFVDGADRYWQHYYNHPDNYLGIYRCKVKVPRMNLPPLPVKLKTDAYEKMVYPVGTFTGTWCSPELKYAESLGCEILECEEFIVYTKKMDWFSGFVNHFWNIRTTPGISFEMSQNAKLTMNSLYGKLAETVLEGGGVGKYDDFNWDDIDMGRQMRVRESFQNGVRYVIIPPEETKRNTRHTVPCIPSFVTSYARLKLLQFQHAGEDAGMLMAYCDTDSAKFTNPDLTMPDVEELSHILRCSDNLGDMGYEHSRRLAILSQKVYLPLNAENEPEWSEVKIKGAPKRSNYSYTGDLRLPDTVTIHADWEAPIRERGSIIRGLPQDLWVPDQKAITGHGNKRVWFQNGCRSMPITL